MECFRNHRRFSSSLWINNEVIHIYILSYTCEVLFFLIHNEQTVKILNIDCFLSSHYQTETRSNKLHAVWETITYSVRYTISPIMLPDDTVNSDSIEPLSFMIYTDSDSSVFLAIYPLHCPTDSRVWSQTFTQCFCQLRADLEIFWLEIGWSKTTIRISSLKSTGLGSWQTQCSGFLNFTK